jgi:hypothetical protein
MSEVFTATKMKSIGLYNVTPCSLTDCYQHFALACCLHVQSRLFYPEGGCSRVLRNVGNDMRIVISRQPTWMNENNIPEDEALAELKRSQDISQVNIVLWVRHGRPRDRSAIPSKGKRFFFPPQLSDRSRGPPSLLQNGYSGYFPGG